MEQKKWKNMLLQILTLLILMGVTFYLILRGKDLHSIWQAVVDAKKGWIIFAAVCMVGYIFFAGYPIRIFMSGRRRKVSIGRCFEYAFTEFYFSAITPSSTGGQPVQLMTMIHDGYSGSDSTVVLMAMAILYKMAFLVLCVLMFFLSFGRMGRQIAEVQFLAILGLVLHLVLIFFLLAALYSQKIVRGVARFGLKILGKLHIVKDLSGALRKLDETLDNYHDCAAFFKDNPKLVLKSGVVLAVQRLCQAIVPYCIYRAFGLHYFTLFEVLATQLLINLCCDMMPLPGAVGISETVFLLLFGPIFSEPKVYTAVLLCRGISFYFMVVVSAIAVIAFRLFKIVLPSRKYR